MGVVLKEIRNITGWKPMPPTVRWDSWVAPASLPVCPGQGMSAPGCFLP